MSEQLEIEDLARQVRTLRRVLYSMCGVGVLAGLLAATNMNTVPDLIQAKKFEVVNEEGKGVVVLSHDSNGGLIGVHSKTGKLLVNSGVLPDGGGGLEVMSSSGRPVLLLVGEKGGGKVQVGRSNGVTSASLYVEDGEGKLMLIDEGKKVTLP